MRLLAFTIVVSLASATVVDASAGDAIVAGRVHRERGFAPPRLVDDLRADVTALAEAGLFSSAGSGGRAGGADTVRDALYCDPVSRDRSVGNWHAFFATWERLDVVRQELAEAIGLPLLEEMEMHYVHYEHGGHYHRHVDESNDSEASSRRCVSFVLYLTPCDEPWEHGDGGALRAFSHAASHNEDGGMAASVDILPESGQLVLFDACTVEHEVLPTRRKRTCLIGWFHTPVR